MMQLQKYKLKEVATFEISSVDKKTQEGQKKVRLCNFVDVYKNWAITHEHYDGFMIASAKDSEIAKLSIKKGQVAITKDSETRDDIGVATYIADDFEDVVLGYHCALITPNPDLLDGAYLNAFMHSKYIQRYFENNATGSGMRYTLSVRTIEDIPLLLPPLPTQRRIANVLSTIDRKIALNRAMNEELEAMAKQLYDYWFVQFDFPDANGKPYRSSGGKMVYNPQLKREIPQGWEVKNIGDVAVITNGATPSTREEENYGGDIVWITPDDLSKQKRKFTYFSSRCITEQGYKSCSTHLMPAGTILLSSRAPIGLLSIAMVDLCTNQGFKSLVPIDMRYTKYLYYSVQTHVEQIKKLGTGSTFSEISKKDLEPFPILMASDSLIEVFNQKVGKIFDEQFVLVKEIDRLTSLRDELLPLLMNGQVEVKK